MDRKLEAVLIKRYPKIFKDYDGDYRYTCMAWGLECGDGWFELIDEACNNVTKLSNSKNIQLIAHQVKEKFGGLRFYYGIEYPQTFLLKISYKLRSFIFHHKFGKQYWLIVDFRKKFWKNTQEKIDNIISNAEDKSYKTCETCGRTGKERGQGWIVTMCDNCYTLYKNKTPSDDPKFISIYEMLFGDSDPVG